MLAACSPANYSLGQAETPLPETAPTAVTTAGDSARLVTITGWFVTVWNDEPHYALTDEQGQKVKLLLDDTVAKPLGGPLELDRKRVTIVGEVVSESPLVVRVLDVQFVNGE